MIVAVHVADTVAAPTVINAPTLKQHLLIFDPTSEATPLGDLPWYEQGSFALLMAGDEGDMLRMPGSRRKRTPPISPSMRKSPVPAP